MPHFYNFHGSSFDFSKSDSFDFTDGGSTAEGKDAKSKVHDDTAWKIEKGEKSTDLNGFFVQEEDTDAADTEPGLEGVTIYLDVNQNAADGGHHDWIDMLDVSRGIDRDHSSVVDRDEGLEVRDEPAADDWDTFTYTIIDDLG